MHLGDGVTRVQAGERLEHILRMRDTNDLWVRGTRFSGLRVIRNNKRIAPEKKTEDGWLLFGEDGDDDDGTVVEQRRIDSIFELSRYVLVFREGFALPTRELLRVVNNAHPVLVLGDDKEYFYLQDDFVLSTREEQALMEWA